MEAARKALAQYDYMTTHEGWQQHVMEAGLADALRALITPPNVAESEDALVDAALRHFNERFGRTTASIDGFGTADQIKSMVLFAVRAGIQIAHETWEPADHPSQEMMLRWLGIKYYVDGYAYDGTNTWKIAAQSIEKEED